MADQNLSNFFGCARFSQKNKWNIFCSFFDLQQMTTQRAGSISGLTAAVDDQASVLEGPKERKTALAGCLGKNMGIYISSMRHCHDFTNIFCQSFCQSFCQNFCQNFFKVFPVSFPKYCQNYCHKFSKVFFTIRFTTNKNL